MFKLVLSIAFIANFLFCFVPYEFKANRITKPPVIDGYLNDPCWDEATRIEKDFRNYDYDDPEYGKIAPVKTIVLVGYDDENLYVGVICEEPEISTIRARAKNQSRWWESSEDDQVGVVIIPNSSQNDTYGFQVNANSISSVYFVIPIAPELFAEYCVLENFIWYVDAKILDTCWTVEMQIPFQSLKVYSNYIDYFRMDVHRIRPREYIPCYRLSPYVRGELYLKYFARMHINDWIAKPERIEFLPYLTGGLTIDTLTDPNLRLGFGGKYYFNYDNILDFAILPDFSQIETDVPQIDVNTTSALYYEEKRPFFLERKAFFETPLLVFYSRMINDPFGAIKYTGSIKDYSMGYIFGLDRHTPFILPFTERSFSIGSNKMSTNNILRLKKTLLKDTYFGLLSTDREIIEGGFNRTFGLDGAFGFLKENTVKFQGILTWTKEPFDTLLFNGYGIEFNGRTARFDGEEFTGNGMLIEYFHKRKYLNFNGYFKTLSPEFRADLGFINYNDWTKYGFSVNFPWIIKKYFIESVTPELQFERAHRYFGINTGLSQSCGITLQFKYLINTRFIYQLIDKFYRDMWFNDMWSYSASLSSYTLKFLSIGMFLNYGRSINYYSTPLSLGYNLYPYFWFDYNFGPVSIGAKYYQYLFWSQKFGEWIYNQKTFELNLSYTFTRFMGFRVIGQYNSSNKNLLIAPLFSFTPTPLTLFYLGANHNFNNETPLDIGGYEHTKSQIFLKVQYLFRH